MGELVDRDVEHLRLLEWAYYILAGVTGLFSLLALLYVGLGAAFTSGAISERSGSGDPRIVGMILLVAGLVVLVIGLASAALLYLAGRYLRNRRHRIFCIVVAVLCCLQFPWGTVIGIWTIVALSRASVRALFEPPASNPV